MKIAVFELEDWEREVFEHFKEDHDVALEEQPLTRNNVAQFREVDIISVFAGDDISEEILDQLPNLRLICTRSTGFDHIDSDYCRRHGIMICNVPTYGSRTVAEHVFALLLAISHRLPEAIDRTRKGDFSQVGLQGFDLDGKTLGVIGTGDIGRCTIIIAKGFNMRVLAFDVHPQERYSRNMGFDYVDLETLLRHSDVISLHVPSNEKTRGMIGKRQFEMMKDGAVLINTARGDLVDIEALLHALVSNKLRAAGLDVLPEEPSIKEEAELLRAAFYKRHKVETLLADHIVLRLRNVIVTPHSAFNTREAVMKLLVTTVENIVAFIQGRPQNIVVQPERRRRPEATPSYRVEDYDAGFDYDRP